MDSPQPRTERLSEEALDQVADRVKRTMVDQQARLLEIAGRNALELVREQQRQARPSLLNSIDEEIENTVGKFQGWRNEINERNHDNLKQIEMMWKRTERFVEALEVPPAQEEIKQGGMAYIDKGKSLTYERMKVIKFADREGWSVGLRYLGDNIADTEAEAKAMRKSVKDIQSRSRDGQGRSDRRYTPYGRPQGPNTQYRREPIGCRDRGSIPEERPDMMDMGKGKRHVLSVAGEAI